MQNAVTPSASLSLGQVEAHYLAVRSPFFLGIPSHGNVKAKLLKDGYLAAPCFGCGKDVVFSLTQGPWGLTESVSEPGAYVDTMEAWCAPCKAARDQDYNAYIDSQTAELGYRGDPWS